MPLYEYHCDACGRRFELIRKFSDPPLEQCPHCGGTTVRKLFSSPAIQFKGSGFYITDYAKKDHAPAGAGDAKTDTASKDNDTGTKVGDKGEKSEKSEKPTQGDKPSTKTETTPAKAPAPSKDSSS